MCFTCISGDICTSVYVPELEYAVVLQCLIIQLGKIAVLKDFLLKTFVGKLCTRCVAALKLRPKIS